MLAKNGIEYYYPAAILDAEFGTNFERGGLSVGDNQVSGNGRVLSKVDLSKRVVEQLTKETVIPLELEEKVLMPLQRLLSPS